MENKISDLELGWLAGIIDGEGNFTIRLLKRRTKYLGTRIRVQPQFTIANTDKKIIDKIAEIFDKLEVKYSYRIRDRRKKYPRAKVQYVIEVYSAQLKKLLPYLKCVGKAEEVEIIRKAIEFQEGRGKAGRHTFYTAKDLAYLYELRNRLLELHGRQATRLLRIDPRDFQVSKELLDLLNRKISLKMVLGRKSLSEEARKEIEKELKEVEAKIRFLSNGNG